MQKFYRHIVFTPVLILLFLVNTTPLNAQEAAAIPVQRLTLLQYIIDDNRPVLVSLLTKAGLVPMLSGDEAYTLLAPPEKDLEALKEESPEKLKQILSGYILKGAHLEKDLKDGSQIKVISGNSLTVCRKRGTLINGVRISAADNNVRNGVVHSLDNVLSF
ncbi:fasciclin domain-containing protein [Pontibacter qinzhouensis]|uniref:Fasciclin domain-containing protein n=1 Tax=Pontibacter qinzhouensis TaxID=2603253 RepID=A0A5C8J8J0_9BACT|nr:fasciclin domain-containing protein [Pontibacter qinzhouensis]TXK33732.1 fasciclin domain-containing protein [Pontibacter qinzhouensis]